MDERNNQREQNRDFRSEFAQEASPDMQHGPMHDRNETRDRGNVNNPGTGFGIAGIVFSVLSFFLWPYLLAPIGIILGVIAVSRKSTTGWWAIGIGVIALILITIFTIFAIPFRILF